MALVKCSECGREISDKAAACVGCGAPVDGAKPAAAKPAQRPTAPAPARASQPWWRTPGAAVGAVAILAGLSVLGSVSSKRQAEDRAAAKAQFAEEIDAFRARLVSGPFASIALRVAGGSVGDGEVVVAVADEWHGWLYQVRLQAAQNLWREWAEVRKTGEATIHIVDRSGNPVGGGGYRRDVRFVKVNK
jgi:hypothetical protein